MISDGLPDQIPAMPSPARVRQVVQGAVNEWLTRHWPLPPVAEVEADAVGIAGAIRATAPALVGGIVGHLEAEGVI